MELLTDNPITDETSDRFGFGPFVNLLEDAICDTESLPFTVGIFGEWGTGKTSLMHILCQRLKSQGYKTIWFNPWKYDNKEELWTALIRSIILELYNETPNKDLKEKAWNLVKEISWLALKSGIPTATSGIISQHKVERLREIMATQSVREHNFINKFESNFSELIVDFLGENDRLIIFIDDLDRCVPENAITVLESLKLYLDNPHCVFVLGMDRAIIELGIRHRYGGDIKLSGREYLEKIVQLPFFLPPIPFKNLQDTLKSQSNATEYTTQIWDLLRYGLGGNPRKAKRFVNSFYMAQQALEREEVAEILVPGDSEKTRDRTETMLQRENQQFYLAKVLVTQMSYTDFYDYLLVNPSGWSMYEEYLSSGILPDDIQKKDSDFVNCWNDRHLRLFMQKTQGYNFPPAPSPTILEHILRFVGIVEKSPFTEAEEFKSESDFEMKK